jgi:hypothetical protein
MNKEELKQKIESSFFSNGFLNIKVINNGTSVDDIFNWIETNIILQLEKEITKVEDQHPYKQAGNLDSYSKYNEGWSDACDVIRQSLIPKEDEK